MNAPRFFIPLVITAAVLAGCGQISFARRQTTEEMLLKQQLRSYYTDVGSAFAAGNAQRLASLFDASITQPMSRPEILAWAEKFFGAHGRANFRLDKLDIEQLGFIESVVVINYSVETPDGKGSFQGIERDYLKKQNGRWSITKWEKLPAP